MLTFSAFQSPLRHASRTTAALALVLVAFSAQADDLHPIVGGGLGAVAGAVIGQSVGGRQGAIIGAAVGGAAGVTLATQGGHHREPERVVVQPQPPRHAPVYGPVYGPRVVERVVYYHPAYEVRHGWGGHRHGHGPRFERDRDERRFDSRDDYRRGGDERGRDHRGWDRRD